MSKSNLLSRRAALKITALTAASGFVAQLPLALPTNRVSGVAQARAQTGPRAQSLASLSVEEVIAALKQLQLQNVSLYKAHAPWSGTAAECRAVAQKFKDAGIAITGSGVVELPNEEAAVRKAFENARAAGLPTMICKPATDAFPLVEKFVKEFDLKLAIHNHGPEDKVYPSPLDAWKAVQPFDRRIGLCIDVGHAARAGADPAAAIRTCAARLYDVHLKDSIAPVGAARDVPIEVGRGQLDIRGFLAALIEIKYPHVVAFEYEKRGNDKLAGLAESIGYVRGMLAAMAG